jgi:hypothetical protein
MYLARTHIRLATRYPRAMRDLAPVLVCYYDVHVLVRPTAFSHLVHIYISIEQGDHNSKRPL